MRSMLPNHLGRTSDNNFCATDIPVLNHFCNGKTSFLDIGCANGEVVHYVQQLGLDAYGIDGDQYAVNEYSDSAVRSNLVLHDYTTGISPFNTSVDLVWSMDFVEHVETQYINNFMDDFLLGSTVVLNTPPLNAPGWHHVNTQNKPYWIDLFETNGFTYDSDASSYATSISDYYNRIHGQIMIEANYPAPRLNYMVFTQ